VRALAPLAVGLALAGLPLTVFSMAMIATAALLGAAFAAYLAVVDGPAEWAGFELGACAVAALLTLAGTSLRFPDVVSGVTPSASVRLAWLALAVSGTAAVASLAREHLHELWHLRDAGLARLMRRT